MFATDFVQYWVHRAFHRVPALWRFHAVHHSAKSMDWMAGARMHFLEIIVLRGLTAIPMFTLGFEAVAIQTYLLIVYFYSAFIHANIGWELRWADALPRDAALSPLAPRRGTRGDRRELRHPLPAL